MQDGGDARREIVVILSSHACYRIHGWHASTSRYCCAGWIDLLDSYGKNNRIYSRTRTDVERLLKEKGLTRMLTVHNVHILLMHLKWVRMDEAEMRCT
jgi:hypothetical protein